MDPQDIGHWSRIPAVSTAAFREFDFSLLPPEVRTRTFHSSGTTAADVSRHVHSPLSLSLYEASVRPWFERHLREGLAVSGPAARPERLIVLTPDGRAAPHSSLVHMFETVRREREALSSRFVGRLEPDGSWGLDMAALETELREAEADQAPVLVLGTAFLVVHWLDRLAAQARCLRLPPGSALLETGGYKGRSRSMPRAELFAEIEARLGIGAARVVGEYGMCELGSQAYDHIRGASPPLLAERQFRFPPWARAVVVSPETGQPVGPGETGLLHVVDLANVSSVVAVQTQDVCVAGPSGFRLVGREQAASARGCSLLAA